MILLDTTVLSYAVGTEHPLRTPCRRLLRAHADGRVEASTTVEVLQEFLHVRARRTGRVDAISLTRNYTAALSPLLGTRAEDLATALDLFGRYAGIGAFDAVLAAVALNRQVEALVSADKGFGEIQSLPWIDPATAGLDRLIGGQA